MNRPIFRRFSRFFANKCIFLGGCPCARTRLAACRHNIHPIYHNIYHGIYHGKYIVLNMVYKMVYKIVYKMVLVYKIVYKKGGRGRAGGGASLPPPFYIPFYIPVYIPFAYLYMDFFIYTFLQGQFLNNQVLYFLCMAL